MIQGESSATVILGSFHLNCCKEQFFHDKQIASVPQQPWVGGGCHCHPLPPWPFLRGALSHPAPQGSAGRAAGTGRAGPRRDPRLRPPWCPEEPSHTARGIQPQSSRYGFEVKRLSEIKNQRKPLPNRLLAGVRRARASAEAPGARSGFFTCNPGIGHAGGGRSL